MKIRTTESNVAYTKQRFYCVTLITNFCNKFGNKKTLKNRYFR